MRQDGVVSSSATPPTVVDDGAAGAAVGAAPASDVAGSSAPDAALIEPAGRPSAAELVELDAGTIELARAAAVADAGTADHVGEFVSAVAEDDIAVTATFCARQAGYLGWHWSVTLARVDLGSATVSEVVLLPGQGALLAPAWIPWDQRIRPGDVGVGDLLPPIQDDPRLVPAYVQSDDPAVEAVAQELGIGRVHVLSREGRVDFAERLHDGTFGPTGDVAVAAPANCWSCAFYLPLAGSLGQLLGACGNEYSPADGRVVDADFGCGAHSETVIEMPARSATTLAVIDELSLEVHRRPAPLPVADEPGPDAPGSEVLDSKVPEPEVLDPEVLDPEVLDPDVAEPDVAELDVAELDAVPDVAVPDVAVPDIAEPDVAEHEDLAGGAPADADSADED